MDWHKKEADAVVAGLESSAENGLTSADVEVRQKRYGFNELHKEKPETPLHIFFRQFNSPLVWILIAATIISAVLKEFLDAIVIFVIVLFNSLIGLFQEYRAERAIESLEKLAAPHAKVIRSGQATEVESRSLVPGDILLLETGDKIPADSRLIEVTNLQTQEAALTGESTPSTKDVITIQEDVTVADRTNMVYAGTIITRGRAKAIVTATGMTTEFGKIAKMIQEVKEEKTPLQKKIAHFARLIGIAALIVIAITFALGLFRGQPILKMFLLSISLAIAAVPEGLPIVVTISLALGVQRMIKRNALIRHLPSVETLGSVSVICSDKTGTLTHNEMTVRKIWIEGVVMEVSGSGYGQSGLFSIDNKLIDPKSNSALQLLLKVGVLCNNARIHEENGKRSIIGDPTEGALIVSAEKAELHPHDLNEKFMRVGEIEFTSERKTMSVFTTINDKRTALTKGALDVLIEKCDRILINGKVERITRDHKKEILEVNEKFAQQALRVLAFSYKDNISENASADEVESNMVFIGLQAMIDPPHDEARDAITKCTNAGIKVVMITGDHKTTAHAIAQEIGIVGNVMTGYDLETLSDQELQDRIDEVGVFARVNPEHKMKIINAFKAKNHIVAMTGDGVNDAPALKRADIGIAMGIKGTDVSKEASDMILTDDNFASIVNAVEEGRTIFDNIRKFVMYLISSNLGELFTIFVAILLNLPLPLIAIQILWINLVTDGAPATALSVEPSEDEIMKRPPRTSHTTIVTKRRFLWMVGVGFIMMLGTVGVFLYALLGGDWVFGQILSTDDYVYRYATTLAFTTLVMFQMFNVLNSKVLDHPIFMHNHLRSNKWLLVAIASSILLQVVVIYTPFVNDLFKTVPLSLTDWIFSTLIASSVLWLDEILKFFQRKMNIVLD